jgi:four helix bundle protein
MRGPVQRSHKNLIVWNKAIEIAVELHRATRSFPPHEKFGLAAQMSRAATSVPSNIAEGAARRTTRDFIAFMHIARGSIAEIETHLLLANRLGYLDPAKYAELSSLVEEVGRMVNGVISGLQQRQSEHRSTV